MKVIVYGFKYGMDQRSRRANSYLCLVQLLEKASEDRDGKNKEEVFQIVFATCL